MEQEEGRQGRHVEVVHDRREVRYGEGSKPVKEPARKLRMEDGEHSERKAGLVDENST